MAFDARGIQLTERAEELLRFRVPLPVDKQKICDLSPTASSLIARRVAAHWDTKV